MFQGMTIGEQRTLLALVVVITLGLAHQAYRQSHSLSSVYVERGGETAAPGAPDVKPAPLAASTPAPSSALPAESSAVAPAPWPAAPPPSPAPQPAANASVPPAAPPAGAAADPALLNLNTATQEQLEELPGIGPVKAKEIVTYRSAHGPFRSVDRLGDVPGIGDKTLEALRPVVCVGP